MLKASYLEHVNRRNYKRLFPVPKDHVSNQLYNTVNFHVI